MPTRIRWPEADAELTDAEVAALHAELDALGKTGRLSTATPQLRDRFQPGVTVNLVHLTGPQFLTLLRAFDHLRNADQLGTEGRRVRDAMVSTGIGYRLDLQDGSPPRSFTSYAGKYETGDRLVASPSDAFRVTGIRVVGENPTVLLCARCRQPSLSLVPPL
jgi:hypothetical protein